MKNKLNDEDRIVLILFTSVAALLLVALCLLGSLNFTQIAEKQRELEASIEDKKAFAGEDQTVEVVKVVAHNFQQICWFSAVVESPSGRRYWRVYGHPPLEKEKWKIEVKSDGKVYFVERCN